MQKIKNIGRMWIQVFGILTISSAWVAGIQDQAIPMQSHSSVWLINSGIKCTKKKLIPIKGFGLVNKNIEIE